jgi:hypothetical protein
MAAEAVQKTESSQTIKNYLQNQIVDWDGLTGKVTFDSQGNTQGGFILMNVTNKNLVQLN